MEEEEENILWCEFKSVIVEQCRGYRYQTAFLGSTFSNQSNTKLCPLISTRNKYQNNIVSKNKTSKKI
jgi:hypothetical protein